MAENLRDIFEELDRTLDEKDKQSIRTLKENELLSLHISLGLLIRNTFVYPKTSQIGQVLRELAGDDDGISTVISRCYWMHLRGEEIAKDVLVRILEDRLWMLMDNEANNLAIRMLSEKTV